MSRSILSVVPAPALAALALPAMVACEPQPTSAEASAAPTASHASDTASEDDSAAEARVGRPRWGMPRAGGPRGLLAGALGVRPRLRDADRDGVPARFDCDDTDPQTYPGAPESCDGVDRDCDGVAMAPESVLFIDEMGNIEDMSPTFSRAGAEAPQDILLDRVGELRVCPTTLHATFTVEADVTIRAVGGRDATVIDAGRSGTVVDITGDGLDVVIEGLTIRGGQGEQGGGISCSGHSELTLFDTAVRDNQAREGGGIYSDRCEVEAYGLQLKANRAVGDGAGMVVDGGSAWIEGAFVGGNHAEASAGGIFVRSNRADTRVELVDTMFQSNESADYAGGLAVESLGEASATVQMVCSDAETGGFIGNRSQDGAHFGIHANHGRAASLTMDGCSLNREDSAGQGVVASDTEVQVYTELDGAAVDCDGEGCR